MKHICSFLFVFLSCALLFCAEPVVEVFPSGDMLSKDEINWLPNAVEDKFESNISRFTKLNIVNGANKRQIINIQKESESGAFDEKSAIEVGKLTAATHGFFLNVRFSEKKYTVSLNYTDLSSGKIITSLVSFPVSSIEELYINNGCCIDELTIDLCDSLNLPLSPSDRYVLLNGDKDLPDSERNLILQEDIKNYSEKLNYLNKQISIVSGVPTAEADVQQAILEAQLALTEERLKKANADKERALAYEENRRKDEILDLKRGQEQKEKISKMSQVLAEKMAEFGNVNSISLLGKIDIIESVKKTYVEVVNETDLEKERILNKAASDISFKKQELKDRPLNNSEVDSNGKMTSTAVLNREQEFLEFKQERDKQSKKELSKFVSAMEKQQKALLKEIDKGYKKIKSGTITNLSGDIVYEFGNYDGERFGWDIFISVESDDRIVYKTSVFLSYEELTGSKPVTGYKSFGYNSYIDNVDFYSSIFSRGEPYMTFSLDYSVEPLDKRYPSKYKFSFSNLQVFETKNVSLYGDSIIGIPLVVFDLDDAFCEVQMYPSYDLRTTEELQLEARHFEEALWGSEGF